MLLFTEWSKKIFILQNVRLILFNRIRKMCGVACSSLTVYNMHCTQLPISTIVFAWELKLKCTIISLHIYTKDFSRSAYCYIYTFVYMYYFIIKLIEIG